MERRVLVAISLSFLVLFLFQRFVMPDVAPPASAPAGDASAAATAGQAPVSDPSLQASRPPGPDPRLQASTPSSPEVSPDASSLLVSEQTEREIVVDTTTVRAVFTNRGARLLRWTLKAYQNDAGESLELVPGGAGADAVKPFSLAVEDVAATSTLNGALYRVSVAESSLDATSAPATITFELATTGGLTAKKTFTLQPAGYTLTFSALVEQAGQRLNPAVQWGPGLGDDIARAAPASFFSPSYNTPAQAIVHKDGSVERIAPTATGTQTGPFRYAGVDDHYFAALLLNDPASPSPITIDYRPVVVPWPEKPEINGNYVSYAVRYDAPRDSMQFFFGPKAFDDLRAIDVEMVRVINFGIFSWLAVPLLNALKWVHGYVGNWGWAIVALTVLINLAMFPLRHKSVVSMRKMQDLQPQMKAIQDRYAKYKITDPERQKMNTEVMELYKAKGVNPASGCVPMLLTLPFLFAFYSMLSQAIEIRGAHFVWWIHNLSAPDPLFISPLVMGATMFWQQKMTPTTADPTQQKIMMFMPVMFTFMSLSFPSGLVIYWTVSNIWSIGQQLFTNYLIGPPKPATK
jgi:YidC/Oxa1 family membrane protein insertase